MPGSPSPRCLPAYSEGARLDLALWNTVSFRVVMPASFRALTIFAQRSRADSLTGAPNRDGLAATLRERLHSAVLLARQGGKESCAATREARTDPPLTRALAGRR